MHPVLRDMLRPRHVFVSLLVAMVAGTGALGAVGFASATDGLDGGTFLLARPHLGDRASYVAEAEGMGVTHSSIGVNGVRSLSLEARPGQRLTMPDGMEHDTYFLRVSIAHVEAEDAVHDVAVNAAGQALASLQVDLRHVTDDDGDVTVGETRSIDFGEAPAVPCGLLNPLQGRAVELRAQRIADPFPCQGRRADDPRGAWWLQLVGLQQEPEGPVLVAETFLGDYPRPFYRLWFKAEVPYPVRIEELAVSGRGMAALALERFERGSMAPQLEPPRLRGSLPALAAAPVRPWLLADDGVDHPFPLSAAFQAARDHPSSTGFREFLAQHPEAYVASASHRSSSMEGEPPKEAWWITLTDGRMSQQFYVERTEAASDHPVGPLPVTPPAPVPTVLPGRSPWPTVRVSSWEKEPADGLPPRSRLPAALPTVASLLAQWQAMAPSHYHDKAPNDWQFYVRCSEDECARLWVYVAAGHNAYRRTYPDAAATASGDPLDVEQTSQLVYWSGWDDAFLGPAPQRYFERSTTWNARGADPPAAAAGAGKDVAPVPRFQSTVWAFPSDASAIGAAALVPGLLYWLWPWVKTGFGMFSRIESHRVLDNPTRRRLLERIEAEPGVHHGELVRMLGKGQGATEHHLRHLERAGLIKRLKCTGYTCYFPKSSGRQEMAAAPLLKSPVARAIVEAARAEPGVTGAELARRLRVSGPTVHYHVQRLKQGGLLAPDAQGVRAA